MHEKNLVEILHLEKLSSFEKQIGMNMLTFRRKNQTRNGGRRTLLYLLAKRSNSTSFPYSKMFHFFSFFCRCCCYAGCESCWFEKPLIPTEIRINMTSVVDPKSKHIEFVSGSWILAQFVSGSRSKSGSRVILKVFERIN